MKKSRSIPAVLWAALAACPMAAQAKARFFSLLDYYAADGAYKDTKKGMKDSVAENEDSFRLMLEGGKDIPAGKRWRFRLGAALGVGFSPGINR